MPTTCAKLLKEWAIVCRALGDGRQLFVARKGGISEEEGTFVVENREFFLFPTYLHQNRTGLDPRYHQELERIGTTEPRDGQVSIRLLARVTDQAKVTDPRLFQTLSGEHIWTERLLLDRFEWGSERSLTLMFLRVYKLSEEIRIPMLPKYGGCKSWVTVEKGIPIPSDFDPILSDQEFNSRRDRLLAKLKLVR